MAFRKDSGVDELLGKCRSGYLRVERENISHALGVVDRYHDALFYGMGGNLRIYDDRSLSLYDLLERSMDGNHDNSIDRVDGNEKYYHDRVDFDDDISFERVGISEVTLHTRYSVSFYRVEMIRRRS